MDQFSTSTQDLLDDEDLEIAMPNRQLFISRQQNFSFFSEATQDIELNLSLNQLIPAAETFFLAQERIVLCAGVWSIEHMQEAVINSGFLTAGLSLLAATTDHLHLIILRRALSALRKLLFAFFSFADIVDLRQEHFPRLLESALARSGPAVVREVIGFGNTLLCVYGDEEEAPIEPELWLSMFDGLIKYADEGFLARTGVSFLAMSFSKLDGEPATLLDNHLTSIVGFAEKCMRFDHWSELWREIFDVLTYCLEKSEDLAKMIGRLVTGGLAREWPTASRAENKKVAVWKMVLGLADELVSAPDGDKEEILQRFCEDLARLCCERKVISTVFKISKRVMDLDENFRRLFVGDQLVGFCIDLLDEKNESGKNATNHALDCLTFLCGKMKRDELLGLLSYSSVISSCLFCLQDSNEAFLLKVLRLLEVLWSVAESFQFAKSEFSFGDAVVRDENFESLNEYRMVWSPRVKKRFNGLFRGILKNSSKARKYLKI